jgi:hypothetical protein
MAKQCFIAKVRAIPPFARDNAEDGATPHIGELKKTAVKSMRESIKYELR